MCPHIKIEELKKVTKLLRNAKDGLIEFAQEKNVTDKTLKKLEKTCDTVIKFFLGDTIDEVEEAIVDLKDEFFH